MEKFNFVVEQVSILEPSFFDVIQILFENFIFERKNSFKFKFRSNIKNFKKWHCEISGNLPRGELKFHQKVYKPLKLQFHNLVKSRLIDLFLNLELIGNSPQIDTQYSWLSWKFMTQLKNQVIPKITVSFLPEIFIYVSSHSKLKFHWPFHN